MNQNVTVLKKLPLFLGINEKEIDVLLKDMGSRVKW